jgi:hypothetical protein
MDSEPRLEFPLEVQERMRYLVIADIDNRVKDLTTLVSLQESELVVVWIVILGLVYYAVRKDFRGQRDS